MKRVMIAVSEGGAIWGLLMDYRADVLGRRVCWVLLDGETTTRPFLAEHVQFERPPLRLAAINGERMI